MVGEKLECAEKRGRRNNNPTEPPEAIRKEAVELDAVLGRISLSLQSFRGNAGFYSRGASWAHREKRTDR